MSTSNGGIFYLKSCLGKQFKVELNSYIQYSIIYLSIYIFQEPRVIFFLGFEAFAPTNKVLLMSLRLESSSWLCLGL